MTVYDKAKKCLEMVEGMGIDINNLTFTEVYGDVSIVNRAYYITHEGMVKIKTINREYVVPYSERLKDFINMVAVDDIKYEVDQGSKVHWAAEDYEVRKDKNGYYVVCEKNDYVFDLTHKDGTLCEKQEMFFKGEK